jgi:hypothetical protein
MDPIGAFSLAGSKTLKAKAWVDRTKAGNTYIRDAQIGPIEIIK